MLAGIRLEISCEASQLIRFLEAAPKLKGFKHVVCLCLTSTDSLSHTETKP